MPSEFLRGVRNKHITAPSEREILNFLHTIFEAELECSQDKDGNIVIGDTVFTPVSVLRADPTAYDNEFSNWLSEEWLPEQNESLEEILKIHANRKRFADLCTTLTNGELIPIVGSGMSVPAGLETWSGFLRTIRKHSSMSEDDLEKLLSSCAFEEAAEQLSKAMPGRLFDERIEHDLRIDDPKTICGAVVLMPEIFDKLVLTTNLVVCYDE